MPWGLLMTVIFSLRSPFLETCAQQLEATFFGRRDHLQWITVCLQACVQNTRKIKAFPSMGEWVDVGKLDFKLWPRKHEGCERVIKKRGQCQHQHQQQQRKQLPRDFYSITTIFGHEMIRKNGFRSGDIDILEIRGPCGLHWHRSLAPNMESQKVANWIRNKKILKT